ncbi:MAG TPA: DUF416 family protein [Phenylobacterium sp.]|uniref:DUF416 family protein n=1 Tax=Phenylobacterium sp. TaxID=1871053 RepID=UPI002CEBC61A|nr:DUF416 family protein [Phenylobacterium sp.]HSV01893.1 DUF416 family protein [Phenylobacterium sp.]
MKAQLAAVSQKASVVFAACCASRLLAPYETCQEEIAPLGGNLLRPAIDRLWNFVEVGEQAEWKALAIQLVAAIPDEDINLTFGHCVIDDALAATAYAIQAASGLGVQNAVYSGRRLYETVDRFAGLSFNITEFTDVVERNVLSHPVVQMELERQCIDVDVLVRSTDEMLPDLARELHERSTAASALPVDDLRRLAQFAAI